MAYQPTKKPKKAAGGTAALAAILAAVVSVEGGYVNHKDDPGGATHHGVTEKVARESGFRGDMRDLTKDNALAIYETKYVNAPGFRGLVDRNAALAEEVIDQGVNMGPRRPSCYLQTALNALNRQGRDYADLAVDCRVGPATLAAYEALERKRGRAKACEVVVKLMDAQQGSEYLRLAARNASLESFVPGWIDHRIGNVPLARCAEGAGE